MSVSGIALQRWRLAVGEMAWSDRLSWALPLVPMWLSRVVLAVGLLPEVTIPIPSLNDDAAHYSLILNASRAISAGLNPVDHWAPDLEIGYPQFAYYQHVPHLFVVALNRLLLRQVDLLTLFNLTRYVLLVGFPITVYWSMRQFGFSRQAAGAAAAVAPLLSAGNKFGFEYDSYIWRGYGMYTQLWAMHLTFLSLALVHRTLRDGDCYFASVLALSALVLSHVIYAFIVSLTLGLVLLAGMTRANARERIVRLALVGAPALIITSYFWLPFILNGAYHTTSPYMQDWKYDSFGASQVLTWLAKGELLDYNRVPVITAFGALGIFVALWQRNRLAMLSLAVFGFWLVAYFGRPTLGPVADLLSFNGKLWMHRYIVPMQLGVIMLVAVAAGGVWALLNRYLSPSSRLVETGALRRFGRVSWPSAVFAVLVLAVTITALTERWQFFDQNTRWMQETQQALNGDSELSAIITKIQSMPPGRVYAGVRDGFSDDIKVGSLRIPDVLTFNEIETAAPPYQSLSLNSDLIWHFDYNDLAHYEVLNARYVILPASLKAPHFLTPIISGERYQLLEAPSGGYIGLAQTPVGFEGVESDYHIVSRAWFLSRSPGQDIYPAIAIPGAPKLAGLTYEPLKGASSDVAHLHADYKPDELGAVESETDTKFNYEATVRVDKASTVFLKATFHPDWHVYVNGEEVQPFMLAPSYPAIHLEPGTYDIYFVYKANALRTPLLALGLVTLGLVVLGDWKRDWLRARLGRSSRR
jgi:hypothetical protein